MSQIQYKLTFITTPELVCFYTLLTSILMHHCTSLCIIYFTISIDFDRKETEATTRGVLSKKVFLKISQNSQENTCARVSFLITLLKKRLWHRCFLVNFAKFSRTPFLQNTCARLLLKKITFAEIPALISKSKLVSADKQILSSYHHFILSNTEVTSIV